MLIESIRHRALRRLAQTGNRKGLVEPDRLTRMLSFIMEAQVFDELLDPPNYGFHALGGNRLGTFAMTVTKNWRMTFTKVDDQTIADLDLEDYH